MSVPQDATKNHPATNNKEQKVIVLSMKNMPSFKFDVTKSLLTSNQDNGQSVFSFKPQQLLSSPTSSHTLQVAQTKTNTTNIQVVSQPITVTANSPVHHQKIQGTAGTILIRAQSPTTNTQKTQQNIIKPQQISLIQSHPTIKIQDSSPTGLRKISSEITLKNHAGHTLLLHPTPTSTVKAQTVINQLQIPSQKKIIVPAQSSNQTKMFQISCNQNNLPKQHVKIIQSSIKESKPIPILPKPENTQKIVLQQHVILPSTVIVQQSPTSGNQKIKPNVITIPVTASSLLKNYVPHSQQQTTKWTIPSVSNIFPPALAPIQPKVTITQATTTTTEKNDSLKMLMEIDEIGNSSESENFNDDDENDVEKNDLQNQEEKTPEKVISTCCTKDSEQQFLNVKRIIEGDDDLQASEKTTESKCDEDYNDNDNEINDLENKSEEIKESCEQSKAIISTTTTSITNKQQNNNNNNNSNNSILLCDEFIANITPEESPKSSDKSKDQVTPMHTNEEVTVKSQSVEDVKKNLKLDLISNSSAAHDKIVVDQEVNESIINDDDQSNQSSMIEQKKNNDDNNESSPKSEMLLDQASTSKSIKVNDNKPKRTRKPKNPTVITSLGLPYKPPQPSSRKKKVEKKVELEMDFHDPLNKILWEDGIGGLNNCNKLFGFNEFGLIEVLNKKDATAKLKYDENPLTADDNFNFKFRKIADPQDQFTCVICSKLGTIRDFFSPECCSESCFAITKRKTTEFNTSSKDENGDSGHISSTDAKKVIFEGELVSLHQLQQYLLEQQLPETKRKHGHAKKSSTIAIPEVKFSWDSYLTAKSVPAPEDFFIYTSKTASNHFRVGMKLEAVDPKNQHLICVCSVEEKLGCRIKIHFDGFPSSYDFWTNSDSFNIFNVGFCQSSGRKLNVPQRWSNKKFDWTEYFDHTNSVGAQLYMFSRLNQSSSEMNPLKVGMKVEVKHGDFCYAATIIDVLNLRVLIRFDGIYENFGCYWFDIYSPYLLPCNGHKTLEDQSQFKPPFISTKPFDWTEYIKTCGAVESPADFLLHKTRKPYQFEPGMKLEVVDKVNPQLIRPATVLCRNEYKIQVIFDGFDIKYAYWLDDDSEDIHPINYCKQTEHPIEHPAGALKFLENSLCSMNGCRGIGNGLYIDRYFHDNPKECPYNIDNWKRLIEQKENSRMDYKPYVRRNKSSAVANENRSLLLQQNKYKKEKQELEIKEEPAVQINEDDTASSENVRVPKKRAKKRKIVQSVAAEEKEEIVHEDEGEKKVKIRVIQHFLAEYGPQMNYAYDLWTKNSKILDKAMITDLSENPIKWNVDDVCTFLVKFCDEETAAKFYAQKIDGEALLGLCQKDLVTLMDIKIGPAIKIYNRILWLRQEVLTKFTEF
ncbi:unnamed protein product [Chironomus riparius]|uniref:SAM domain-containing protein n=1 Tax=Chironomus riparius TaxID=315576 RepID=A0A9N9RM50_9DIPT|nr:unnamed protein product [Chironomus riparius]